MFVVGLWLASSATFLPFEIGVGLGHAGVVALATHFQLNDVATAFAHCRVAPVAAVEACTHVTFANASLAEIVAIGEVATEVAVPTKSDKVWLFSESFVLVVFLAPFA